MNRLPRTISRLVKNIIFVLLLASPNLFAQQVTLHQNTYWLRYQNQLVLSGKLNWTNEIDERRFFGSNAQNQLIAHSYLRYSIHNFEPGIGCTFSWQYASEPEATNVLTVPEIRPFQELSHRIPISKNLEFQERLRIDERFIRNHTFTALTEGYDFLFRFRVRLQMVYKFKEKYTLKLGDEIMVNDRHNTFDQNRVLISIDKKLNKNLTIEAGYIHIYQMRSNNKGYFSREVARLSLSHKIFIKQKAS